ncbi:hypothetical protein ILYODFUR_007186 [Ilyodon furcidens]|uniref:Uncharacterized protein n=1 Tax=Ilyodon furcidens TaxID=33524 RepID=A0ABV0V107_9TELE
MAGEQMSEHSKKRSTKQRCSAHNPTSQQSQGHLKVLPPDQNLLSGRVWTWEMEIIVFDQTVQLFIFVFCKSLEFIILGLELTVFYKVLFTQAAAEKVLKKHNLEFGPVCLFKHL